MKKALLALPCVVFLYACTALSMQEPLSVTIADLKPIEVGLLEQRYALKVRVLNPNDVEIAFDGVVFDLEVNDVAFAKGVSNQKSVIPRFGEAVIDVQAVSGLQNILMQINELLKGERTTLTYRIKGRLHTGGFGYTRFDSSGEIALPAGMRKSGS
jgi:LEA14-like dessication related protein